MPNYNILECYRKIIKLRIFSKYRNMKFRKIIFLRNIERVMNEILYPKDIPAYFPPDSLVAKQLSWDAMRTFCSGLNQEKALERAYVFLKQYAPVDNLIVGFLPQNSNQTFAFHVGEGVASRHLHEEVLFLPTDRHDYIFSELENFVRICHEDADLAILSFFKRVLPPGKRSFIIYRIILEEGGVIANFVLTHKGHNQYGSKDASFLHAIQQPIEIFFHNFLEHYRTLEQNRILSQSNRILRKAARSQDFPLENLPGMAHVCQQIRQGAPLDTPVIILGETGVGKEVVADALQDASARNQAPYIKVNCGAIPEHLVDSELFGHEKGAFTGAVSSRAGRFERANRGTLLLDEIGELPLNVQARLLRVLQSGEIDRVGGSHTSHVDVRLIAATHVDLLSRVHAGAFREDLFYRLNVFPIRVAPLRERPADIPILTEYFLKSIAEKNRFFYPELLKAEQERLNIFPWPGNVRQLRNTLEYSLILWAAAPNMPFHVYLPNEEHPTFPQYSQPQIMGHESPAALNVWENTEQAPISEGNGHFLSLDEAMDAHIRKALEKTQGRINGKNGAAELLGINPNTLRSRMDKRGIPYGGKATVYGENR